MNKNTCKKAILKTAGITILAALFYIACDDNGVIVVTPDVSTFTDSRDGKVYKKVLIGEQIWMAENLRYEADNSICYSGGMYLDTAITCKNWGRLYDWNTAMDGEHSSNANPSGIKGVCPAGWHLPSDAEWTELIDYVGENAGTKLKSREFHDGVAPGGTPSPDGTDKYRFSALDGPMASRWWSTTEMESDEAKAGNWYVSGSSVGVTRYPLDKHAYFLSVRCVHD